MTILSPNTQDQQDEVTLLELFSDLVFVLAVSQLAHHLLEHLSWLNFGSKRGSET